VTDEPGRATLQDVVASAFSSDGPLSRAVEHYEPREGQRQMADAVAAVIADGGTLLAEAGTGTGKTLAYLIPAILSGGRVLVSTGTKNLQEQIYFKDVPALRDALGIPFTATLLKGRGNYLCLHRFEQYRDSVDGDTSAAGRLIESGDRVLLPVLNAWARTTDTGDRAELRDLPDDLPLWRDIAADADTCLGQECPRYSECFVTRVRQQAAESDVVIVNHHLLCADASVRQGNYGEVIPDCATLVVDEAHQLEDVATQYFGVAASSHRVDELVRDGERAVADGLAASPSAREGLRRDLMRVADHARAFFGGLVLEADGSGPGTGGGETKARYTADSMSEHFQEGVALAGSLDGLQASATFADRPPDPSGGGAEDASNSGDLDAIARRAGDLARDLKFLVRANDPDFVYYLETRGRGGVLLRAAPIDVSRIIRDALFDRMRTVVLTSATLAVDGSFDYARGRLGLREADEIRVASEFDYRQQAVLYLPRRMPAPKHPTFAEAAAKEVLDLLRCTEGRAFVLFTSYAVLRTVQRFLEMTLPYPVLVQGSAPRTQLIDQFRTTPNAVLLATSSFWQGVDVVGDALSCVIIDKLPFASPSDPVTAARIEAITARGGDAFAEYTVPLAILTLQQGLGRLIRHRTDRGVLAILDPRLRTMGYGQRFLSSLPPAPVTMNLEDVARFLRNSDRG
jgi:ATP-dependent DNA helicase DinG